MLRTLSSVIFCSLVLVTGCKRAAAPAPTPTPTPAPVTAVPTPTVTPATTTAAAPTITVFGLSDTPASVVFLINHSATATSFSDPVRLEMARVIADLKFPTKVAYYVFSEDLRPLTGPTLSEATPELRATLAAEYAKTDSSGSIENEAAYFQSAFHAAFRLQPEAIFLVTYSKSDPKCAAAIKLLNNNAHARINVLALIADPSPEVEAALAQIAHDSGGQYKLLREKDVGKK